MPDSLRITVDDVRKRMEAGEEFIFVDTRNPQAWSQSDVKLPKAIRVPLDSLDENLSKIPKDRPIVTLWLAKTSYTRKMNDMATGSIGTVPIKCLS
jgi:rhodanese-related sulfurtransferase